MFATIALVLAALAASLPPSSDEAAEARKTFESLYGRKIGGRYLMALG